MNNLNTMLREASTDAPPDHLDLDVLVAAGRSRVRRRRAVTGAAAAAVVGLAAGAALVLPGGDPAPQQAEAPAQELTLDDAVFAVPDVDYRVTATLTAHSTDEAMDGDFVRGVLADGRIVVERYPGGSRGPGEITMLGAGTPGTVPLPRDAANYLGASGTTLVFSSETSGLWLLDADHLGWRHVLERATLDANVQVQPLIGHDGRVYLSAGPEAARDAGPIYEVDVLQEKAVEIARGGDVAAYAGGVAWTDAAGAPVGRVTVRDADGQVTGFDPQTGDCIGIGLGMTRDRVVLMTNCESGAGDDEYTDVVTRVDVFDLEGNAVARITGDADMGPVRMADRYLTLSHWSGARSGTYVYDLEDGRFLRVTDQMSGLAGNETGMGSTVVWEERLDGATGARYVLAQMR